MIRELNYIRSRLTAAYELMALSLKNDQSTAEVANAIIHLVQWEHETLRRLARTSIWIVVLKLDKKVKLEKTPTFIVKAARLSQDDPGAVSSSSNNVVH
jgi:TPP-dependent 2-oxoacid decarboxylase